MIITVSCSWKELSIETVLHGPALLRANVTAGLRYCWGVPEADCVRQDLASQENSSTTSASRDQNTEQCNGQGQLETIESPCHYTGIRNFQPGFRDSPCSKPDSSHLRHEN
ncbi:MAG: hypothetical protein CMJ47_01910 [Planctomyces sp.]|nr:hypothetical protein [Planctomyces sp.]